MSRPVRIGLVARVWEKASLIAGSTATGTSASAASEAQPTIAKHPAFMSLQGGVLLRDCFIASMQSVIPAIGEDAALCSGCISAQGGDA